MDNDVGSSYNLTLFEKVSHCFFLQALLFFIDLKFDHYITRTPQNSNFNYLFFHYFLTKCRYKYCLSRQTWYTSDLHSLSIAKIVSFTSNYCPSPYLSSRLRQVDIFYMFTIVNFARHLTCVFISTVHKAHEEEKEWSKGIWKALYVNIQLSQAREVWRKNGKWGNLS